ncbi:hypothetical protein [Brevibacterium senegalense]|uniref:hypothetical protein n=1 Tax=Brevibacterium senegalense TaxID=1033736 RepID=UPI00031C4EBB|nr:hypothetical protein [Brevibacterium senegalense]
MRHHKPVLKPDLDAYDARPDPAQLAEIAHATAALLVHGSTEPEPAAEDADSPARVSRAARDDEATARFVHLADDIGLEAIAEIWSTAPAVSLPGVLWRLYALREWIARNPRLSADEFTAGRAVSRAQGVGGRIRVDPYLAELIAGVEDPPGPDQVVRAADQILAGAFRGDFAMALLRAAAFAEVAAAGRWELDRHEGSRAFEQLASDLTSAARAFAAGSLG